MDSLTKRRVYLSV